MYAKYKYIVTKYQQLNWSTTNAASKSPVIKFRDHLPVLVNDACWCELIIAYQLDGFNLHEIPPSIFLLCQGKMKCSVNNDLMIINDLKICSIVIECQTFLYIIFIKHVVEACSLKYLKSEINCCKWWTFWWCKRFTGIQTCSLSFFWVVSIHKVSTERPGSKSYLYTQHKHTISHYQF